MTIVPRLALCTALTLLVTCVQGQLPSSYRITCTAITTPHNATVTCFFPQNLSHTRHNFNIRVYPATKTGETETLLTCGWLTSGTPNCTKGKHVHFDNVISTEVKVTGPTDMGSIGSQYVCSDLSRTADPVPCDMIFKGKRNSGLSTNLAFLLCVSLSTITIVFSILIVCIYIKYGHFSVESTVIGAHDTVDSKSGTSDAERALTTPEDLDL